MKCKVWVTGMAVMVAAFASAASRAVDYAAEDAAFSTVKALRDSNVAAQRIAVLPLAGDRAELSTLLRSELVRYSDYYEFYVRNDAEWNGLLSEIEFGDRRGDVMDAATIQKFGKVKGVDAILYGAVREASTEENGDGRVRLNLMLADVETGQQLWAGMIEGEYLNLTPPDTVLQRAAVTSAEAAAKEFAQVKSRLGTLDILIFPLVKDRTDFSDVVSAPFVNQGDRSIRFFKDLGLQKGHRKVLTMVKGRQADSPEIPAVLNLLSSLGAAGLVEQQEDPAEAERPKAVLIGRFGELTEDALTASLPLNLTLVDLKSGQVFWSTNVEPLAMDVRGAGVALLSKYGKEIAIAVGVIGVLLVLVFKMRRPR